MRRRLLILRIPRPDPDRLQLQSPQALIALVSSTRRLLTAPAGPQRGLAATETAGPSCFVCGSQVPSVKLELRLDMYVHDDESLDPEGARRILAALVAIQD